MKYANDNPLGERFDQNRYIGAENAHFNRIVYANSNFYTLIKDTLFKLDLSCLTQIESIPNNKSSGYCKMCVFNDQIIVTNERQFFKLADKFEETHFFFDDTEITPKNVVLYDFNNHSTICTQWNNRFMLFEIGAENCKLLFSGSYLEPEFANGGLQIFKIGGENAKLVVDLTLEKVQISYCFEKYSTEIKISDYVTEYDVEAMKKILPDYESFNLRRNRIYEEMQAKMPPKVTLESVITKMYPNITTEKFPLQNSYQLEDKLIFYKGIYAYVTDMNKNVLERVPIDFIASKASTSHFIDKRMQLDQDIYDKLWYCNNTVYALVNDVLFSVDVFKFKELQKIPGEYGSGYVRICVYNDQILTTNEKQFFLYNPVLNKFVEKKFYLNGKQIQSRDVALHSYGPTAIARIFDTVNNKYIVQLKEQDCEVIHCGKCVEDLTPSNGAWLFDLGVNLGFVDLTSVPVKIQYCYDLNSVHKFQRTQFTYVQSDNSFDYPKEIMDMFVDEDFFDRRNQLYQNQRQNLGFKQLNVSNKFGRIQYQSKQLSFTDIFKVTNLDIEPFEKLQQQEFVLKFIRINSQSSFRRHQVGDMMGFAQQQGFRPPVPPGQDPFIQPPFGARPFPEQGFGFRRPIELGVRPNLPGPPIPREIPRNMFNPRDVDPFGFGRPQNFDQFREQ
ncbi:Conserved_hypothetical protein [Hexamita inflata]|uniref:F5/8 type C domain-containing protein n=1 Tax=Hexamita inflata TaxID=28002 RepID=A0ABP1H610_9EUKA